MSTGREVSYRAKNFIRGLVNDAMGSKRGTHFQLQHNTTQFFHNNDRLKEGQWRDSSAKRVPTTSKSKNGTKGTIAMKGKPQQTVISDKEEKRIKRTQKAYKQ